MLSKNQIKELQSLQLKKSREARRLFIVEGIKTVLEVVEQAPLLIQELLATVDFIRKHHKKLEQANIKYTEITEIELSKISLQATPSGVLAICHYLKAPELNKESETQLAFYLDDIRDPGNFGTIMRLCDWFGLLTLYCSPACCDVYNPKVIQATMGAFLRVSCVYVDLKELLAVNKINTVYGAVLDGKNIYKEKLQNGLILIGNEANGISEENLQRITHKLTIPAHEANGTESLNAAMAASIMASEFFRQLRLE